MRIAVSGTANTGKTTFIQDFLKKWPQYTTPERTYRDIIKEKNLEHSDKTSKATQQEILNYFIDTQLSYTSKDNVIFDRCSLDNLVYSMWANYKQIGDIDNQFISDCINQVRESMSHLDLIFFAPLTKSSPIPIEEDGFRQTDKVFIEEIDNIFKGIYTRYKLRSFEPFFKENDVPAIIEIFGNRAERIYLAGLYVDSKGESIEGNTDSLIAQLEGVIRGQKNADFAERGKIYTH